ncbi:uncharacterized protein LOC143305392 isoform X2 [Osmia lignaria lignaria]|uniref:uncharacterized protein LOC143305392 isoform X2 n=1 Tax=Osmia lignaria lignaria TaxID=1437193 RepID=UPI00402BCDC3
MSNTEREVEVVAEDGRIFRGGRGATRRPRTYGLLTCLRRRASGVSSETGTTRFKLMEKNFVTDVDRSRIYQGTYRSPIATTPTRIMQSDWPHPISAYTYFQF